VSQWAVDGVGFLLGAIALGVGGLALARTLASRSSASLVKRLDEVEARSSLWKTTAEELIERGEDVFSRVERKRASAAASASRAEAAREGAVPEEPPQPRSRAHARLLRRSGQL